MRPGTDLLRSRGARPAPGRLSWPLRAPARHPGHLPVHCPGPGAMTGGRDSSGAGRGSESWRPRRCHAPRGYASLCWPASVPAGRSRVVWGRQGDWLSGRAPRSHRGGHWFDPSIAHQLRIWRKARSEAFPDRPHPPCGWGLPVPGPDFSARMISPVPSAPSFHRMMPPRAAKPPRSPVSTHPASSCACRRWRHGRGWSTGTGRAARRASRRRRPGPTAAPVSGRPRLRCANCGACHPKGPGGHLFCAQRHGILAVSDRKITNSDAGDATICPEAIREAAGRSPGRAAEYPSLRLRRRVLVPQLPSVHHGDEPPPRRGEMHRQDQCEMCGFVPSTGDGRAFARPSGEPPGLVNPANSPPTKITDAWPRGLVFGYADHQGCGAVGGAGGWRGQRLGRALQRAGPVRGDLLHTDGWGGRPESARRGRDLRGYRRPGPDRVAAGRGRGRPRLGDCSCPRARSTASSTSPRTWRCWSCSAPRIRVDDRSCGRVLEVVPLVEVLDEPGLRRLPSHQLAGQRA